MYLSTQAEDCKHDSGVSDMDSSDNQGEISLEIKNFPSTQGSLEYSKLWEELRYTSLGLDELFEESKTSAFEIKQAYDNIKQLTTINEALRLKYYEALSTKKRFDEERDEYFKIDAELAKKRDDFIEDSQRHAFQHSRYVEYSKRFSQRREEYIERLLQDVEKYFNQVEKLSREKMNLRKEISEQRQEISSLKYELKNKTSLQEKTALNCERLNKEVDKFKKELQWMTRQNGKLKETKSRLEDDKENMKTKEEDMKEELQKYMKSIEELSEKRSALQDRCSQLNQRLKASEDDLEQEIQSRNQDNQRHEDERRSLNKSIADLEKQKKVLRENSQKAIRQMEQVRKSYDQAKKKSNTIEKAKNVIVSKESDTRGKNVELAEKQLELIDEVLSLKKVFFQDQGRIIKGARQYRRLEGKMGAMKQQMELLKENPSIIDPLEFSQEYREVIVKKYAQSGIQPPLSSGDTYHTKALKHHIPVIGQIPEPRERKNSAKKLPTKPYSCTNIKPGTKPRHSTKIKTQPGTLNERPDAFKMFMEST